MPIAIVPQKQILITAFAMFDPPVLAAITPDNARKTIENEYWYTTICLMGANIETKRGRKPPDIKEAPEANAACNGFGCEISLIPNSSLACASNTFFFES